MNIKSCGKGVLISGAIAILTQWAHDFFTKKQKNHERKEIYEVIMFSSNAAKVGKSKLSRCIITESMKRLLYHLKSTQYTMDVCMNVMTSSDISNVLLQLHHQGVKIRIIVDADMGLSTGSIVMTLVEEGIPVRCMKSINSMHHKFTLIDASVEGTEAANVTPVLMVGSMNWTNQALNGNFEDVAVTSEEEPVRQYKAEFDRLWVLFKPIVDSL